MQAPRCSQCSLGGKVAKRRANYATHLLVLGGLVNRVELACERHARMACKVEDNFAVALAWPVMTADSLTEEDEP